MSLESHSTIAQRCQSRPIARGTLKRKCPFAAHNRRDHRSTVAASTRASRHMITSGVCLFVV